MNLFGRKLKKPVINTIEVAIPLYALIGLKFQTESYDKFLANLTSVLNMSNPLKTINIDPSQQNCLEAMLEFSRLNQEFPHQIRNDLTISEYFSDLKQNLIYAFRQFQSAYDSLDKQDALEFMNKSLYYIQTFPNQIHNQKVQQLKAAARQIPISKSGLIHHGNWAFVQQRAMRHLNFISSSLEAKIFEAGLTNAPTHTLKQRLSQQSHRYKDQLSRAFIDRRIQKLLNSNVFKVDKNTELEIANQLQKTGILLLPIPQHITTHTEKDLNDLARYQFANDDQYLVEEPSNSRDAKSPQITFTHFDNGLKIDDTGNAINKHNFFNSYPFPYISVKDDGEMVIGRFGVGAKAKLVEVVKNHGEVYVESKSREDRGYLQHYFLDQDSLCIGFANSNLRRTGVRMSIFPGRYTPARVEQQKELIRQKLRFLDPRKFSVYVTGRFRKEKVNAKSIFRHENLFQQVRCNQGFARVYFDARTDGLFTLLSGEQFIREESVPFESVIDLPLTSDPIEGRNDFVYDDDIRQLFSRIFKKVFLPELVELSGKNSEVVKDCVDWFAQNHQMYNPFYHFEQLTDQNSLLQFYNLLHPTKPINMASQIVMLSDSGIDKLNEIFPSDIFIGKREYQSQYMISLRDYVIDNNRRVGDGPVVRRAKNYFKSALVQVVGQERLQEETITNRRGEPIQIIYSTKAKIPDAIYCDPKSKLLIVQPNHKVFAKRNIAIRQFYLEEMIRLYTSE